MINSACISKVASTGYTDILDERYERKKGVSDGSKFPGLKRLKG